MNFLTENITPDPIITMKDNGVFVYGANKAGIHGGGAALIALQKHGAKYGIVHLNGNSYGLCTKDENIISLDLKEIQEEVDLLEVCVKNNPDRHFYITKVGCGLAGFTIEQIAPLFKNFYQYNNISLPLEFKKIIYEMVRTN